MTVSSSTKMSLLSHSMTSVRGPDPILEYPVTVKLRQKVRRDELSQDGEQLLPVALSACSHLQRVNRESCTAAAGSATSGAIAARPGPCGTPPPLPPAVASHGVRHRPPRRHRSARTPPAAAALHRTGPETPGAPLGVAATQSGVRAPSPAWMPPPPPSFDCSPSLCSSSKLSDWTLSHVSLFRNKCTSLRPYSFLSTRKA